MTRNPHSFSAAQLLNVLSKRQLPHVCFSFSKLTAQVGFGSHIKLGEKDLSRELDALIVRPVGRGSIEELIFRMDLLDKLERLGVYVVNSANAIERCIDKYAVLAFLEENGLPVPKTVVTENVDEAVSAMNVLGGDIVVKPLFGSRGKGSTRIADKEIGYSAFRAVAFYHGIIYLQEFVQHGFTDIRAFVIGDRVVAAMRRVAQGWKTNCSQGARPEPLKLDKTMEDLAIRSSTLLECKVAGVDILESELGPAVIDVNSQPGWKGLQLVSKVKIADEIVSFVLSSIKK